MNIYFYVGQFIVAVVLVVLYYKFIEVRKIKKFTKDNIPVDLKLLIKTQKIDVRKISYKKLVNIVAVNNAITVGIVLLLTNLVDSFILKFLISIPIIFVLLYVSYSLIGLILKKKGMTKDES